MKEKALMTSFFASSFADIGITAYEINIPGFREVGFAANFVGTEAHLINAFVFRVAVPAVLIGIYALAKNRDNFTWSFSTENALKIGNIYQWGVVAFNTIQILPYLK